MTSQEKKRYLQLYRHLDAEINRLLRERELWMARATRMTPALTGMPGGYGDQRGGAEDIILKIVEIDNDINRRIDELIIARTSIITTLDAVEDPTLRRLLELRYLDGETFEQIAVEMNKSWRWIITLHGRALEVIKII